MSLTAKLVSSVPPRTFYEHMLGIILPAENAKGDVKIPCPFHEKRVGYPDETGSFSINMRPENAGYYQCFGGTCGAKGTVINFVEEYKQLASIRDIANFLIREFDLDPTDFESSIIDQRTLVKYQNNLHNTPKGERLLKHIREVRMLSDYVIDRYKLGMSDEGRLAIPVLDADGSIVDVRGWLPEYARKTKADHNAKMVSLTSTGANRLYPRESLKSPQIIYSAGEMDTLALLSLGYQGAITGTAGEGKFNKSWIRFFAQKSMIILQDADNAGQMADDELVKLLYKVVADIKIPVLDWSDGVKDTTQFIHKMGIGHAKAALDGLFQKTSFFFINDDTEPDYAQVTLFSAGTKQMIGKKISLTAIVLGNETNDLGYYAIPRRVTMACTAPQAGRNCMGCPHIHNDGNAMDKLIDLDTEVVVELLNSGNGTPAQLAFFKKLFNVEGCRNARFTVAHDEFEVVEPVLLVPDNETNIDAGGIFFQRTGYHVGHGLRVNQRYRFYGRTVVDSRAHVTHVFDRAELADKLASDLRPTTKIVLDDTEKTVEEHLGVFRPAKGQHPTQKLKEIHDEFRVHVTRVVGREDIAIAIDLTYHSPLHFMFGDRLVYWGWISTFIFGDTQVGKTESFNRFKDHFRLGHLYNGESISRAGIVGAYAEAPGRRGLSFRAGIGPKNDGGLIAIDEFTGLKPEQIDELTHMRSSGKAQSTKVGMDNEYDARVRMIALANPREGRAMSTFNPGCHAIKQIIGGEADVARFDIFVAASRDEVKLDDIHAYFAPQSEPIYTSDLCNTLIQWTWSRKASDYHFSDDAQKLVRDTAKKMGTEYDATIPIIAPGSHHWTIARIAAAIAARLYSTNDGFNVNVEQVHVEAARDFLYKTYNKAAMGYDKFSAVRKREETLADEGALIHLLKLYPYSVFRALVTLNRFTRRELEDEANIESYDSKELIAHLRTLNAVFQSKTYWYTTKAFQNFAEKWQHPEQDTHVENAIKRIQAEPPKYNQNGTGVSNVELEDD